MKTKLFALIMIVGLLTACGSQATEAPASPPTEKPVSVTEAPVNTPAPIDTEVSPTEVPTEAPTAEPTASTRISFANDILPILQSRCVNCHGGDRIEEGLVMTSYSSLMAGSDNGSVIVPGDSSGSLLVDMVASNKMPKRGPKLTPPQVQLIVDWVNQGASDN